MPRKELPWKGQEKPQDKETHVLIEEKSGKFHWLFRLRILAEIQGLIFVYVVFVLKGKIIKGETI